MLESILDFDKNLFIFLNGLGSEKWDNFWMFYTTKFNWIPFYLVLLFLLYKKTTKKQFLFSLVFIALLIACTDQVTNLFKFGFKRLRPCHENDVREVMRLVKSSCGGKYGFFSGHSSNSMAIAVFLGLTLKKYYKFLLPLMVVWAILMAYSRIYVGVHYPIDILCGALFGAVLGYLIYFIFNKNILRKK